MLSQTVFAIARTTLSLLILVAPLGEPLADSSALIYSGVVTHVVDGDTVWVRSTAAGETLKVRILDIDAPEGCQAGGAASRAALAQLVKGKAVMLIANPQNSHDDYGRFLAKIKIGEEDVGRWMVASGHAWSYSYRKRAGPYSAEQLHARSAGLGLFGDATAESPRAFRRRHGSCYMR